MEATINHTASDQDQSTQNIKKYAFNISCSKTQTVATHKNRCTQKADKETQRDKKKHQKLNAYPPMSTIMEVPLQYKCQRLKKNDLLRNAVLLQIYRTMRKIPLFLRTDVLTVVTDPQ